MEQEKYVVTKEQLMLDLMLLAEGIFEGELGQSGGGLLISFTNGQQFRIAVEEVA